MKPSPPWSFAALLLLAVMLLLSPVARAQQYAPPPPAQAQSSYTFPQLDVASIQEQGDEMSRRVGNFFKKLFNSDDQAPGGYQQPPQRYQQAPPPQPRRYQQAPPPSQNGNPPPQRKNPPAQQASATPQRKTPARDSEPDKPKRKETPSVASSAKSSPKKAATEDKPAPRPAKREEEPPSKPVAKHKVAEEDTPKLTAKKAPEPPAPKKETSTVKAPAHNDPIASKKQEPSKEPGSTPPSSTSDAGGLSPYTDGYNGGSTVMAPKDSIASKPPGRSEEPQKKEKETQAPAGADIYPTGTRNPDNPGSVVSPYPPHNALDVSGLSSGSLAVDPTTKKVFRIP